MGNSLALAVTLALAVAPLAACLEPAPVDEGATGDADLALCDAINAYRAERALPAIPVSSSLMLVARLHAEDLVSNASRDSRCNLHSWTTGDQRWNGCCYTEDHAQAECMWDKPDEIAGYSSPGYEIAARVGAHITPSMAVSLWDDSDHHRVVMASEAQFARTTWRAMGCAIEDGYAVVWFGELAAP